MKKIIKRMKEGADFEIPKSIEPIQSILSLIPLQLVSYHVSVSKGFGIDRPKNLAKSVTVE